VCDETPSSRGFTFDDRMLRDGQGWGWEVFDLALSRI